MDSTRSCRCLHIIKCTTLLKNFLLGKGRWDPLLFAQGGGRKGGLSRFIGEAARAHLPEQAVDQAGLNETELSDLIDEAVR